MAPYSDAFTLAAATALSLRLSLAFSLLWIASLLALTVKLRADGGDVRMQRSWLVGGAMVVGTCSWAAYLGAVVALAAPPAISVPGAVLAWALSIAGAAFSLRARSERWQLRDLLSAAGGAASLFGVVATWALSLDSTISLPLACAVALACMAAQAATVWTLGRVQRREREVISLSRKSRLAWLPAVGHALPLAVVAFTLEPPALPALGAELLLSLLAGGMAILMLQAHRLERYLVGKHQALGAQLQQAHAHLQRTPLSDPLTGLLSRMGIEAALRKAAMEAEDQGKRIALFAVGLDGFKSVNDSYGHALGDSVLREVARRLVEQTGALVVPPKIIGQHLARLGGDEFVVMLHGHLDRQSVARAASRLLESLDGPMVCDDHELTLAASIGIACFPEDGGASKLIARANAAMQAAKAAGGSTYMTFEPRMQDDARDRQELLRDLRHAIDNKQLELFYQPKIDARSGQVTAAEALLRWHHPLRGMLSPEVFIPLAERHGVIGALGNWVIEDACRQARVWRERGLKMRVAINLSVFQMRQNDLVDRIQASLKRHGVNPQRLTCEITESVAMEDTQVTQRTFERLGQAGIHLSIDDFGTGYSSLSYLRRLPATELKIDRSFVMDLDTNTDARAIVDAVLKLAHAIGLKVVAEGVETIRQRDILLELGCDEFQGYLFARPMSARALTLWAVDDKPTKNAFRPSLFGETEAPSGPSGTSTRPATATVQTAR